jgi:hypothetical protein
MSKPISYEFDLKLSIINLVKFKNTKEFGVTGKFDLVFVNLHFL